MKIRDLNWFTRVRRFSAFICVFGWGEGDGQGGERWGCKAAHTSATVDAALFGSSGGTVEKEVAQGASSMKPTMLAVV